MNNQTKAKAKAKGDLICISARLAAGGVLLELYEVCDKQKTISSTKLERLLEKVSNNLKNESIKIRDASRNIKY